MLSNGRADKYALPSVEFKIATIKSPTHKRAHFQSNEVHPTGKSQQRRDLRKLLLSPNVLSESNDFEQEPQRIGRRKEIANEQRKARLYAPKNPKRLMSATVCARWH